MLKGKQSVNAIAITSITNFMLAGEVLFLAGMLVQRPKSRFSAAWFFSGMMALLGLGALLGGIDHGFFEGAGLSRYPIERSNWLVLGAMTFFLLMTISRQFFARRVQRMFLIFGIVQFTVNAIVVLLVDSFLDVIFNYAPVIIFLLVMNFVNLKKGTGSWPMIMGILILCGASGIQALGIDIFSPLNRNGLYHLVTMAGVVFLYLGGRRLCTDP
jgi:hypothetical protein